MTRLRPHGHLVKLNKEGIIFGELSVPWEENMEDVHKRKISGKGLAKLSTIWGGV